MFSYFMRPLRQVAQSLTGNDTPGQLAWGFTLGMLIGLVPKGNLMAVTLMGLLLGLRVNKPAGLLGAGIFSVLGVMLDSFAHSIGASILIWQAAGFAFP